MSTTAQGSTDVQVAICGSAGDGTIAAGDILKRAMARAGYKVIAFDLYPPEIRGFGKCIARARFTSEPTYSLRSRSDVLVSLDDSHAIPHVSEVSEFGAVLFETTPIRSLHSGEHISGHLGPSLIPYGIPLRELSERATSGGKSRNIVAIGYLAGLFRIPAGVFHDTIGAKFKSKPAVVTESNLAAFDLGYEVGAASLNLTFNGFHAPPKRRNGADLVMMSGNGAVTLGCLDAGIDTFFGYPITPATSIMERLAVEMPKRGGQVLQTEDEISAIAATIGAGYAGARAATATSGPGLALMSELLGLGTMAEVPAVVFASQRGGPSTGMPTKTEQSDLNLAVFGSAGDAERIVLAPTNVEGCYKCAGKAFEMAERYQTPVIVLLDLYISNRFEAVDLPTKSPFAPDCNLGVDTQHETTVYKRYALTEEGVSPRAIPGRDDSVHVITGLEHNELGRPSDAPDMHSLMSRKRHNKLLAAVNHPDINITKRFGDEGPVDVGLLGWGSTFGEILEAMIEARKEGISCAAMKVVMLSPFPLEAVNAFMADVGTVLVPELNYEGQFANLVTARTGRPVVRLNRVTGEPMQVDEILVEIRRLVQTVPSRSVG